MPHRELLIFMQKSAPPNLSEWQLHFPNCSGQNLGVLLDSSLSYLHLIHHEILSPLTSKYIHDWHKLAESSIWLVSVSSTGRTPWYMLTGDTSIFTLCAYSDRSICSPLVQTYLSPICSSCSFQNKINQLSRFAIAHRPHLSLPQAISLSK